MSAKAVLLVMLAVSTLPAHAQTLAIKTNSVDVRASKIIVSAETLTVRPSPEDLPPPVKSRWQRFDEALNAGPSRRYRVVESASNHGVRMECYEPCDMSCCVTSGQFSTAGRGLGR